jgi:hypothetical protein
MGSICGWSGTGLGSEMSQQAIKSMLNKSGGIANAKSKAATTIPVRSVSARGFLQQVTLTRMALESPFSGHPHGVIGNLLQ